MDEAAAKGLRGHLLSGGQKVWVPVEHEPSVSMAACRFFSDDHAHQDHAGRLLGSRQAATPRPRSSTTGTVGSTARRSTDTLLLSHSSSRGTDTLLSIENLGELR